MKRTLRYMMVPLAALCWQALLPGQVHADDRPRALATISILADMVAAVAGDHVDVESIVYIGGDPHVYEPVPSDSRRLAKADIIFLNGLGLERWLEKLVNNASEGAPVVTLTDDLPFELIEAGVYEGHPDPHLWMDPLLGIGYVDHIEKALAARFPEHAGAFAANAGRYRRELEDLDLWIGERIRTIPADNRKLVTTHDAFRYFGARYDLEVVATIWDISTEREPSAREVADIVTKIREKNIPAVFVETTISPKLMESIARDAGVAIGDPLYGDSVGELESDAGTYIGMMKANTESIVKALSR